MTQHIELPADVKYVISSRPRNYYRGQCSCGWHSGTQSRSGFRVSEETAHRDWVKHYEQITSVSA